MHKTKWFFGKFSVNFLIKLHRKKPKSKVKNMKNFNYSRKIKNMENALLWRNELKSKGKKLVVTNGCFDIIHRGHLTYLINSQRTGRCPSSCC